MARGNIAFATNPVRIPDVYYSLNPSAFLQHNFGCYRESMMPWPIPANMAAHIQATMFVPPEVQANKSMMPRPGMGTTIVNTEHELISRISERGDLVGLAQLSAIFAPQLELRDSGWSGTITFVIGDTFADCLTFWNAGLHVPSWLQGRVTTLRASTEDFADEERFKAVTEILRNRIYHPVGGNASHSQITLCSSSVPEQELVKLTERLREAKTWQIYTYRNVGSVDDVVPEPVGWPDVDSFVDPTVHFGPTVWQSIDVIDGHFRPPTILPRHIRDLPLLPAIAKEGIWALDCMIERPESHSKYDNAQDAWILPQRLRMTRAFVRGYQPSGATSQICMPRTTRAGLIALFADQQASLPDIHVPSDQAVFRQALCGPRDWLPFSRSISRDVLPGIAVDMRPSDKGRYLMALLRMAGGIHGARAIFLSQFWSKQFESLGATPKVDEARLDRVARTLRKRLPNGIMDDSAWMRVAKVVVSEARAERSPQRYLRHDALVKAFSEFREAREDSPIDDVTDQHERDSLDHSITYLCQREVLNQGHEWRCEQCFNNNWVSIDDLARTMTCEVCGREQPAPVSGPWKFKPNGFVVESIREHGALPMIWCLSKLADEARKTFYFLAGHELFFSAATADAGNPDAEIDILAVADGEVELCEVKSSAYDVDIEKIASLALRVRPNRVLLAVMSPPSPTIDAKLNELKQRLAGNEIEAFSMTLGEADFDDSTWLYYR